MFCSKKSIIKALLVFALLLSTGCGKKNSGNSVSSYEKVTCTIGANGGQVKDKEENVQISIPSGALKDNTNISAQYVSEAATFSESPIMNFLCGAEFGPSGTTFDKPVEVTLKLDKTPINDRLTVFCYDETNKVWDFVGEANVNDNAATFSITHFSKYQCIDLPLSVFNEYVYIVRDACTSNKTDSWITETYIDYLVNDKHIMDYYSDHDGYVYEPRGFLIGGNFQVGNRCSDANETTYLYGESNQIGYSSTCGYTLDVGVLSSYREFIKQRDKAAAEYQEIIYVGLTVYFKMVKPVIELRAPKTQLAKGESTTVSVHCHYSKPDNFFPENRDIDLAKYKLTLPFEQVHLKTDKKELVTDSEGNASFKVTSKDAKTETIKVMFYVEGTFGEYADAYIEFTGNEAATYSLTVIMHEEDSIVFDPFSYTHYNETTTFSGGEITVTVDYSFTGTITYDPEIYHKVEGKVSMSDVVVNVDASTMTTIDIVDFPLDESGQSYYSRQENVTTYFENPTVEINKIPNDTRFFLNTLVDVIYYDMGTNGVDTGSPFIELTASGNTHISFYSHSVDIPYNYDEESSYENDDPFECSWSRVHEVPFAKFNIQEGTQTMTINGLSGYADFHMAGDGGTTTTTQTVMLSKLR